MLEKRWQCDVILVSFIAQSLLIPVFSSFFLAYSRYKFCMLLSASFTYTDINKSRIIIS